MRWTCGAQAGAASEALRAYCGSRSMCLGIDQPCEPVCRLAIAPLGTDPHSDCPPAASACLAARETLGHDIGVCR